MAEMDGIAATLSQLLAQYGVTRDQMADLLGGAADGGPNGDGNFPVTIASGATVLVPSPRRIALLSGDVTQAVAAMQPILAEAKAAAALADTNRKDAAAAATAAQTSADSIAGAANDATGARVLLERIYGLPVALPNNGNPNSLSFPASSRAAPANKERFDVIIIAPNTASVNLNAGGLTRRVAKPGTGANLDVGQLAAPRIATLERSDEGGNIFLLISQRALVVPGEPTAADLAAVVATANGTGTAFESLLGAPVASLSPDANNIKVTGLAPADGEVIEAYIAATNSGAGTLDKGGVKRRIVTNPGTGAEMVAGDLKAGTIRKFTYSAGGFAYILGAARTPTFNATPATPPPVGSRRAALLQQPWGKIEFPNNGHAVVTPTTHPVLFIGSSNAAVGYAPANAMPSDVAVAALNEFFPGDGSQFLADLQANQGAPWSDAGRQLNLSQAFVDGKVVWVLSLFGMNECRTIFYADYGGLLAQIGAARDAVAYIRSKGAEPVLNTIFDPDPRDPSKLEPDYFAGNPIRSMAYPAYKAAPVDPNLDMIPAGNAMLTEPRDWTGSGILTTGYKRIWQFNRMIRALAAELNCMLLDFAFSCRRNCIEKVPDLSDGLDRYYPRNNGLHPLEALYVEGLNPVYRQWARAMADGRDDIRVFRGDGF